ncbi:YrdB family protein [Aeromicrobium sp.]|uniref:YrdB family protein n=1 Tax=Aeromicrobium sp. TaxID=1871063 RepID=UPI0019B51D08|nr:YrdB family protein [Aeromicrobium sp.]MBC7630041.1 YrdB family protein [Aeromicrobium sp.]
MPPQKPEGVGLIDALAFLCETAMVILLIVAGHGIADGWRGWALGAFLGFVAIGIWAQWMAPTSMRRLDNPTRLTVQVMLFLTVALYAAAGGLVLWGLAFAAVAITVFTVSARTD